MSGETAQTAGAYFDELAVLLVEAGMPADRVGATLDELAGYLAESGGDPEEEFGQAAEFARELTASPAAEPAEPAADTQIWRWTADLFHDVKRLNEYGAQGWEVDTVDAKGLFVCIRDPEHPQQWEYRRELIAPGRRAQVLGRLAPDGWEPCGTWVRFEYFKRPRAASMGPAAELATPPGKPRRSLFLSPGFYGLVAVMLTLAATTLLTRLGDLDDGLDTIAGLLCGAAVGALVSMVAVWLAARRRDRR
ncbi:hypothetical protein GCM10023194_61990 [Planotetraspora phitsanulokensis]|uniref:DUF2812 domain-containing protein n=1 Tax=Planotetraspora phitsanulokensis TaxID=575192 RepID=A0A8J3XE04_9ACTN|nr:hypothetical protein [Planotetraspora phitsanulokensis]GII37580.1 hypothetical protein Pph01_25830 [Planotetraspora phitsanulokensis]